MFYIILTSIDVKKHQLMFKIKKKVEKMENKKYDWLEYIIKTINAEYTIIKKKYEWYLIIRDMQKIVEIHNSVSFDVRLIDIKRVTECMFSNSIEIFIKGEKELSINLENKDFKEIVETVFNAMN